ncbi:MAG: invasion associated locus B family protein [Pseudomonadota bacterium]
MRLIIPIACAAVIAAASLGLAAGYMSGQFSPAAQADQTDRTATLAPGDLKSGAEPEAGAASGPDVQVADTQAAAKKGAPQQFGAWVYSCAEVPEGTPKNCVARLMIRDKNRNITVINWLIGYNKDRQLLMEITTPVDVLIAPGLKMAIGDGAAQSLPYLSCAALGCLTRITPTEQMLGELRQAKIVKLTIETPAGKAITFSIQVSGIGESLAALAQP